jgi:hypothetical protein
MKYLRKKRNLENYTVRSIPKSVLKTDSDGKTIIDTTKPNYYYGKIPEYKVDGNGNFILTPEGKKIKNTIDIDIFITQDIDDMGIFTDMDFVPSENQLLQPPSDFNSFVFGRLPGVSVNFYHTNKEFVVSGDTDDRYYKQMKSYRVDINNDPIYVPYLNLSKSPSTTFDGVIFNTNEKIVYKIGSDVNDIPNTGVKFLTHKEKFVDNSKGDKLKKPFLKTEFEVISKGWDESNTSLSAIVKKEEYLGIVFKPEIDSVVFINRGVEDIFERHAILSEIKTTNDIDTNRGGFIRV